MATVVRACGWVSSLGKIASDAQLGVMNTRMLSFTNAEACWRFRHHDRMTRCMPMPASLIHGCGGPAEGPTLTPSSATALPP
jgi:hypothetical protein